jgi:hypothetical protein
VDVFGVLFSFSFFSSLCGACERARRTACAQLCTSRLQGLSLRCMMNAARGQHSLDICERDINRPLHCGPKLFRARVGHTCIYAAQQPALRHCELAMEPPPALAL